MGKPSDDEQRHALAIAGHLHDHGRDRHYLGQTLLYLHARNQQLRGVLDAACHYLHSGQDPLAHAQLLRAVEQAREAVTTSHDARPRQTTALGL